MKGGMPGPALFAGAVTESALTADTITDDEILELRESCFEVRADGQTYFRSEEHYQIQLQCNVATNGLFDAERVAAARARCAEILNARGGK